MTSTAASSSSRQDVSNGPPSQRGAAMSTSAMPAAAGDRPGTSSVPPDYRPTRYTVARDARQVRTLCMRIPELLRGGSIPLLRVAHQEILAALDRMEYAAVPAEQRPKQAAQTGEGVTAAASPQSQSQDDKMDVDEMHPTRLNPSGATPPVSALGGICSSAHVSVTVNWVSEDLLELRISKFMTAIVVLDENALIASVSIARNEACTDAAKAAAGDPIIRRVAYHAREALVGYAAPCAVAWSNSAAQLFTQPCDECHRILRAEGAVAAAATAASSSALGAGAAAVAHQSGGAGMQGHGNREQRALGTSDGAGAGYSGAGLFPPVVRWRGGKAVCLHETCAIHAA